MNPPVFQHIQQQFLAHLRYPLPTNQPPGFSLERLAVYSDLLYNKFDESLTACFPVIFSILDNAQWQALVTDFIAEHHCLSPYYRQIPDEFVQYLQNERQAINDPPFLAELAHFEWIEMALSLDETAVASPETVADAQLLDSILLFAPVKKLLHYLWPVQDISQSNQPTKPPALSTQILGFRDTHDEVHFIALNAMTVRFLLMLEGGFSGRQALHYFQNESPPSTSMSDLIMFGHAILRELQHQGVIIGIKPPTTPARVEPT